MSGPIFTMNNVCRLTLKRIPLASVMRRSITLTVPCLNLIPPEDRSIFPIREDRPFSPPTPVISPFSSPPSSPELSSPSGYLDIIKEQLRKCLNKRGTKASIISIDDHVRDFCYTYFMLTDTEKEDLVMHVSQTLAVDQKVVSDLITKMPQNEGDPNPCEHLESLLRWEDRLRLTLQPPYHWLALQISRLPGGVKFLVDFRKDLLLALFSCENREVQVRLKAFDAVLRDLLSLWFTVGLLDLQRITWESPCEILEKISDYEAVHPVRNWTDLKRRVGNYRRCFIFSHSCMPGEPLVVLHTFLTNSISESMRKIVTSQRASPVEDSSMKSGEDYTTITTAIFYSITSTQKGLKGIELGNYLIKSVVKELQAEFPHMQQYSSLSPIPGFTKWMDTYMVQARRGEISVFTVTELEMLMQDLQVATAPDVYAEIIRLLKTNAWSQNEKLASILEPVFMRLCAFYLYGEKRRGYAIDAVANFHLKNGAVMFRINWDADRTPRSLGNSCGIMVNYRYYLDQCEKNSQMYLETGHIHATDSVIELAETCRQIFEMR